MILLVFAGSAAAISSYISNPIKTTVVVNTQYVTIGGAFTTPVRAYSVIPEQFTYTLNGVESTTGAVQLIFSKQSGSFESGDRDLIQAYDIHVNGPNGEGQVAYRAIEDGNLVIVLTAFSGQPFTFVSGSDNKIFFSLVYSTTATINARIQIV